MGSLEAAVTQVGGGSELLRDAPGSGCHADGRGTAGIVVGEDDPAVDFGGF